MQLKSVEEDDLWWYKGPSVKKIKLLYMQCNNVHCRVWGGWFVFFLTHLHLCFFIYFFYSNIITIADTFCLWFLAYIIKYSCCYQACILQWRNMCKTPVLVVLNDQVKIFGKKLNVSINPSSAIAQSLSGYT
jgi:hypothetical protein